MRVIAGSARRTILVTPEGLSTRPTTDRIKETLFNMLNNNLYDSTFIDLFSGSGGIGIEALSRGSKEAYFVENDKNAIKCIKENLRKTHFSENGYLIEKDVFIALDYLKNKGVVFDYIFMDPPYNKEIEKNVLSKLSHSNIIDENTMIIVEASLETNLDYLDEFGFSLVKKKDYKTNYHAFIMKS